MTEVHTKHINARVSDTVKEALKLKAKELDRSESWIINEALRAYLFPKPRMPQPSD